MVILGASAYPRRPDWSNPVLGTTAAALYEYVVAESGMSIPIKQVLNLFDNILPAAKQCEYIESFLRDNKTASDFILYYIGHGGFDEQEYYLGIHETAEAREFLAAIESRSLQGSSRRNFAVGECM